MLHYCLCAKHVLLTDKLVCKLTGFAAAETVRAREQFEWENGVSQQYFMIPVPIAILLVPMLLFRVMAFFMFKVVSVNREAEPIKFNILHTSGFALFDAMVLAIGLQLMNEAFDIEPIPGSQLGALVCIGAGFGSSCGAHTRNRQPAGTCQLLRAKPVYQCGIHRSLGGNVRRGFQAPCWQ